MSASKWNILDRFWKACSRVNDWWKLGIIKREKIIHMVEICQLNTLFLRSWWLQLLLSSMHGMKFFQINWIIHLNTYYMFCPYVCLHAARIKERSVLEIEGFRVLPNVGYNHGCCVPKFLFCCCSRHSSLVWVMMLFTCPLYGNGLFKIGILKVSASSVL